MKIKNSILLYLVMSIIFSCRDSGKQTVTSTKSEVKTKIKNTQNDELSMFLARALKEDTLVNYGQNSHFFAGNFFNKNQKHTIAVFDSALEIYLMIDRNWKKVFATVTDISWVQFGIRFTDMNFDSKNDLIINRFASNGFVQAYTHLYIYKNDSTFYKVPEADTIPNLQTVGNKQLKGGYAITCQENGLKTMLKKYFRWKKGKIEYIKTQTPCLPE